MIAKTPVEDAQRGGSTTLKILSSRAAIYQCCARLEATHFSVKTHVTVFAAVAPGQVKPRPKRDRFHTDHIELPSARDGRVASYVSEGLGTLQACELMPAVKDAPLQKSVRLSPFRFSGKGGQLICTISPQVPGKLKITRSAVHPPDKTTLTGGENETGCRRRDVDNKDVSTTGVALSRSRSNESRQAV